MTDACSCGHPWSAHEHVPGIAMHDLPDVWVCSGGRLVDVNKPDVSPWDFVCGCLLHHQPPIDGRTAA
jgi:hypothetical protein